MSKPTTDTRSAETEGAFADAFAREAPEPQLPAAVVQQIIDERPQGAMKVEQRRDINRVMQMIRAEATAAGDDFFYSWEVDDRKKNRKVEITGPSIKCANAVSRIYGNCSVKVRAFDQGTHWIFYAQFYDMETGYVLERPFQQRKSQKIGEKFDADRALDIVFQIAVSKAARNVVCNALSTFTDYAYDVAREELIAKVGKNLGKYRERIMGRLGEMGVDPLRVEKVRGRTIAEFTAQDAAKTISEIQAVTDGMANADEIWPKPEVAEQAGQSRPAMGETETGTAKTDAKPGKDAKAAAKAAETAKKPAETPKTGQPAAGAAKDETPPATTGEPNKGGQAVTGDQPAADQPAGETAPAAVVAADDEEKRQAAFEHAEAKLLELNTDHEGLPGCKDAEEVDAMQLAVKEALNARTDLDPEDLQVILGRWATMCAERKRALSRGGRRTK